MLTKAARAIDWQADFSDDPDIFPATERQALLRSVEAVADIGYWRYDLLTDDLFWSDRLYRIYGYEAGAVQPDLNMAVGCFSESDQITVRQAIDHTIATGEPWLFEARLIQVSGQCRRVRFAGQAAIVDGVVKVLFGICQDITEAAAIARQDALISDFINDSPDGVMIVDTRGGIEWINSSMQRMTGYALEDLHGRNPEELLYGPDTDPATARKIRAAIGKGDAITTELLNYNRYGRPYWVRLAISCQCDQSGKTMRYMAIQQNITGQKRVEQQLREQAKELKETNFLLERQRQAAEALAHDHEAARHRLEREVHRREVLEADLRHLATTDVLTGLPNRQGFVGHVTQEISRAQRFHRALTLMIFDIDHFKAINDKYGHKVGDDVLIAVADIIRDTLRQSSDVCCRWGGEEFCLALPETEIDDALKLAERLRLRFNQVAIPVAQATVGVSCSFGLAALSHSDDLTMLVNRADGALYRAKHKGRNRTEIASDRLLSHTPEMIEPLTEIPKAAQN